MTGYPCLLIRLGAAEAKDEKMSMRVRAGEALPVWSEFTVENSAMTLALDLEQRHRETGLDFSCFTTFLRRDVLLYCRVSQQITITSFLRQSEAVRLVVTDKDL